MADRPLILGIDPGLEGALAFWAPEADLLEVFDMPVYKITRAGKLRNEIDVYQLGRIVRERAAGIRLAVLEKVGAMPVFRKGPHGVERAGAQGAQSAFVFGGAWGMARMAIAAHNIPIVEPTPAVWKGAMSVTSDKASSRKAASALAPDHAHHWARVKDDGRAEAYLLARYGARKEQ